MNNLIDYLDWRGDLSFQADPFNEVDALILSAASYVEFDKIVPAGLAEWIYLKDAAVEFEQYLHDPKYSNVGRIIPDEVVTLFLLLGKTNRYGSLKMTGYRNDVDEQSEEQFAAVSFLNQDNESYVVFRGTDDTIVGWKEDFNIAYMDVIPAQQEAHDYLVMFMRRYRGTVSVMGHSKGGNLAVYSAASLDKRFQKRIQKVYNMDGPGFSEEFLTAEHYQRINDRVSWYLPYESMIGTLLNHGTNEYIVKSSKRGIMQHDPFSWYILGNKMIKEATLSKESLMAHQTIDECMKTMTAEQRKQFVSIVFDAIESTEAKTLTEITPRKLKVLFDALKNMDEDSKKLLYDMMRLVLKTVRENR